MSADRRELPGLSLGVFRAPEFEEEPALGGVAKGKSGSTIE